MIVALRGQRVSVSVFPASRLRCIFCCVLLHVFVVVLVCCGQFCTGMLGIAVNGFAMVAENVFVTVAGHGFALVAENGFAIFAENGFANQWHGMYVGRHAGSVLVPSRGYSTHNRWQLR